MTSMKIFEFLRPLTPFIYYIQNSSTPMTLDVKFQTALPPSPYDNQ